MPDEPEKPTGALTGHERKEDVDASSGAGPSEDAEPERTTVNPPFDPIAFAREVLKPSPSPMAAVVVPPPPPNPQSGIPTPPRATTKPVLTSGPRRKTPPGLGGEMPSREPRRKTPTSTLSLVNARIPSNLPPRITGPSKGPPGRPPPAPPAPPPPAEDDWAGVELATRPPPADGPNEDPVLEIGHERPSSLDLDDIPLSGPTASETHGAETVRRPLPREIVTPKEQHREMNDRVSLGDYSGALEIAEQILNGAPADAEANACAENCRTVLRQMYATRIGPLDRVPVVMVPRDQLRWLSIDHKAGFVLSLVDGVSSLEMIIDVSGMPELDTLRILSELAQQRIISLR